MTDFVTRSRLAREAILSRVRAGVQRQHRDSGQAWATMQSAIDQPRVGPRPPLGGKLVERFKASAERMSSSVDLVSTMSEVPTAMARWLNSQALPLDGVVWPGLAAELDFEAAGLRLEVRSARDTDLLGVTGCFCAVAETGSLLTASAPQSPAATSLLPESHVAVLPASRIVAGMEEAWALARREWGGQMPRALNFISGPSRTGDIELTIVLGAHGPYRVHVIVVSEA